MTSRRPSRRRRRAGKTAGAAVIITTAAGGARARSRPARRELISLGRRHPSAAAPHGVWASPTVARRPPNGLLVAAPPRRAGHVSEAWPAGRARRGPTRRTGRGQAGRTGGSGRYGPRAQRHTAQPALKQPGRRNATAGVQVPERRAGGRSLRGRRSRVLLQVEARGAAVEQTWGAGGAGGARERERALGLGVVGAPLRTLAWAWPVARGPRSVPGCLLFRGPASRRGQLARPEPVVGR